jgi:hypothetical protein
MAKVKLDTTNNPLYQSPYSYLQAAGSTGADSTVRGIHLRWDLLRNLGNLHLPKGNLTSVREYGDSATHGFNRQNDFVFIYRHEYKRPYAVEVNFQNVPSSITETGESRVWRYNGLISDPSTPTNTTNVIIEFETAPYDLARASVDPSVNTIGFLKIYSGIIKAWTENKLMWGVQFDIFKEKKPRPPIKRVLRPKLLKFEADLTAIDPTLYVETISLKDSLDIATEFISSRNTYDPNIIEMPFIICDNIEFVRFQTLNTYVEKISFASYIDFISASNRGNGSWELVDQFSLDDGLSDNNLNVFNRLETADKVINHAWPKYNAFDVGSGAFTVNSENYKNKWLDQDGLKPAVINYLTLSGSDPLNQLATTVLQSQNSVADQSAVQVNYLDLLKLVSLDFHAARMLGFGHIDGMTKAVPNSSAFIYAMRYVTEGDLDNGTSDLATHLYMTIPLTMETFKLPPAPELLPVEYGLALPTQNGEEMLITDVEGYAPFDDVRYINLLKLPFRYQSPMEPFFATEEAFNLCSQTIPQTFGIEYRHTNDANYVKPEINNDLSYFDPSGLNEVITIPETGESKFFTHDERQEGIHHYAAYSVNWFSRPSPISDEVATDTTLFKKRNTLLPPSNLAVQLIQNEEPLLLTTSLEQQLLQNISDPDKTLLRLSFEWNNIHNSAYQFADAVEIFHKLNTALEVRGIVSSVSDLPDNKVAVVLGNLQINSVNPPQTIIPSISVNDADRFLGSMMIAGQHTFVVQDVVVNAGTVNSPTIILRKIRETALQDPDNNNQFMQTETFISPEQGDLFLLLENLNNELNWENKLAKEVYLEKFHTNDNVEINTSTSNDGLYKLKNVSVVGGNTVLTIAQDLNTNVIDGNLLYSVRKRLAAVDSMTNSFSIAGDLTTDILIDDSIEIVGTSGNEGDYEVSNIVFDGTNSIISVYNPLQTNSTSSYLIYKKSSPIVAYSLNTIAITGDLTQAIIAPRFETFTNIEGAVEEFVIGGLNKLAEVTDVPVLDEATQVLLEPKTGVYKIKLAGYILESHIDNDVEWYGGTVRIMEDISNFPAPGTPTYRSPRMKQLNIWKIKNEGADLIINAFDPEFNVSSGLNPQSDPMPIELGASVDVNIHPGYKLYLTKDVSINPYTNSTNVFIENSMLPNVGEGSKQTFVAVRAKDKITGYGGSYTNISKMTTPVVLLAFELQEPLAPGLPSGPIFATRPDIYGKSTYTFDVEVETADGRRPHSLVFYKANHLNVLSILYTQETKDAIIEDLAAITNDNFYSDRWYDLVNVNFDSQTLEFIELNGYKFPIPNNASYKIVHPDPNAVETPFNAGLKPGENKTIYAGTQYETTVLMADLIKDAIARAFVALTEEPVVFQFMKKGTSTSGVAPVVTDRYGNPLNPNDPASGYNQAPMAVKYVKTLTDQIIENPTDADFDNPDNKTMVRFTDYKIDGAQVVNYFYFVLELTNQLKFGPRSQITKPIQLINTEPAERPVIKEVLNQLPKPAQSIPAAVLFKLNDYTSNEGISKIDVYRTTNGGDALTIRTMEKVKSIDVTDSVRLTDVLDDFENDLNPLYGDPLYYRIIANREIINEQQISELIPSKPSDVVLTNIVDPFNPEAPKIISENGTTTATELQNVILKWSTTCYNGTYRLQKMNSSGNWVNIYEVESNNPQLQYPPIESGLGLPDFVNYPETAVLQRQDASGTAIYHRFRVQVENSSGLFNLSEKEITLATGCMDLLVYDSYVSFTDSNAYTLNSPPSGQVDEGPRQPTSMTFTGIVPPVLVAGHNSFVKIEIILSDDLGNSLTKEILTNNGSATFTHGEGGLVLDNSNPNRTYQVLTKLYSDNCTQGATKKYNFSYVSSPCHDISKLTEIVSLTDGNGNTLNLQGNQEISLHSFPTSLSFTDFIDYATLGQTFSSVEITVTDVQQHTHTASINSIGGSVTFSNGDGGLVLDNSTPNQTFAVSVKVITSECSTGQIFNYSIAYTFDPCDALEELTSIVSFIDGNMSSINPLISSDINNGVSHPNGIITFGDLISTNLPAGHIFASMEVTLNDGLGHVHTLPVSSGGTVTFNNGDNGLVLDVNNANSNLYVTVALFTDVCTIGTYYDYSLRYTYSATEELSQSTTVVSFADGSGNSLNPLASGNVNSANPNTLIFTDIISGNLPSGDSYIKTEVTVNDLVGGEFTKSILVAGGNVQFSHGEGGLTLNSSNPNRIYIVSVKVFTTLSPDGVNFVYQLSYNG